MKTPDHIAKQFLKDATVLTESLTLGLDGFFITINSNSIDHLNQLRSYFAHCLCSGPVKGEPHVTITAIEGPAPDLGLDFIDWKREPGKKGRKDAYADIDGGRVVLKVRTGMSFLQSEKHCMAIGPCIDNDNQVINFISAQYMNWMQQQGALICHAAALVHGSSALGIPGLSGGGKSTLMLKVMDHADVYYLTNDRLFIDDIGDGVRARGIPKLPRINPGTILNNDRLRSILSPDRQKELSEWPREDLWTLEEKYDVDIAGLYGSDKIQTTANLKAFLVLRWDRDETRPLSMTQINLADRPDALGAIMKSPGPFYQFADGHFLRDDDDLDPAPYLSLLSGIPIYELSGSIDFDRAGDDVLSLLKGQNNGA